MEEHKLGYSMGRGGPCYSTSPRTPLDTPPIDSIQINFDYEDFLDKDLVDIDDLFESLSRIPSMDKNEPFIYPNNLPALDVHSTMTSPYFTLQFISCMCLNIILCSNSFIYAVGINDQANILTFLVVRLIDIVCMGFFLYCFTSPDTFKSINITIPCLAINSVIYEYSFFIFLRYIVIHLCAGVVSGLVSVGIFYDLIKHIETHRLLQNIFSSKRAYDFGYSFALVVFIAHVCYSIGLTLITSMTTSLNARNSVIHKSLFLLFVSMVFGLIVGPIGFIYPNLCLYVIIAVVRNDYAIDTNLIIIHASAVLCILLFYPFVAIQIKFVWRNKYRRYIEYGM